VAAPPYSTGGLALRLTAVPATLRASPEPSSASLRTYERDGLEVPQWIRDAAEGRARPPHRQNSPDTARRPKGPHPDTPGVGLLRSPGSGKREGAGPGHPACVQPNRTPLRSALLHHDHSADRPPVYARFGLQPVAAQHNLSVPDVTLSVMRIRTIDGPPLDAEIAEMTARALALTQVHHRTGRSTSGNNAATDRPDALTSAAE
jgi:hypothetical protein